jgi:hypothetical protein
LPTQANLHPVWDFGLGVVGTRRIPATLFTSEHANEPNFPPKVHEVVTEKAVIGRSPM